MSKRHPSAIFDRGGVSLSKSYRSKVVRVLYAGLQLVYEVITIPFKLLIRASDLIEEITHS